MLNAFRVAINGSLTQFDMTDGIVDEYEDESGIDTGSSTNEDYDGTNDNYSPSGSLMVAPYAHFKMNDSAANTTVTDDGTGSNNGTASENTNGLQDAGKISLGLHFNGSNSYVNVDALVTDIASDQVGTVAFWFNADNSTASMRQRQHNHFGLNMI